MSSYNEAALASYERAQDADDRYAGAVERKQRDLLESNDQYYRDIAIEALFDNTERLNKIIRMAVRDACQAGRMLETALLEAVLTRAEQHVAGDEADRGDYLGDEE